MSENLLAHETSPYLLQHKDNPVHWMAWGGPAFQRARDENKPVLLSIGYAACHWCHVMAHESFEEPAIAAVMNELFVSIKVDREERPDLDLIYQQALALLGQQGGWPLTMFLDAEGRPFWGGTYFPPSPRWGRPSFPDVLRRIAQIYATDRDKVAQNVAALGDALSTLSANRVGEPLDQALLHRIAERYVREVDPFQGGIGDAPKFPNVPVFLLLLHTWLRHGGQSLHDAVHVTLTRMSNGGIYDHVGGGFARYAVDGAWLVPHFEKMLYDNAQLVELLTLAWQASGDPLYAERVAETIDWLLREMIAPGGDDKRAGFAATLDADSEGEEGRFYVWDEAEIDAALANPDDAALLKRAYGVSKSGNWEGHNILHRNHGGFVSAEEEAHLPALRERLLAVRANRVRPGWDDKVLSDWNGQMIASLAEAGFVFDVPAWIDAAIRAFDFIATELQPDGRLRHAWRAGRAGEAATLDDYAQMSRAALKLYELTGEARFLDAARGWVTTLDAHFWDAVGGGYFLTADDAERLIVRAKSVADHATPSGNGAALSVLTRLWLLTGEDSYRARAEALERAFAGEVERNFFPLATYLDAIAFAERPVQIAIIGEHSDEAVGDLLDVVRRTPVPDRVLTILPPGQQLPAGHPAAGKGQVNGAATAYVCVGPVCSAPTTDAQTFAEQLRATQSDG